MGLRGISASGGGDETNGSHEDEPMKRTTEAVCILLALTGSTSLVAQSDKPISKGYVGKQLPKLEGHAGSDSQWLGTTRPVPAKIVRGEVALVVLTSLG